MGIGCLLTLCNPVLLLAQVNFQSDSSRIVIRIDGKPYSTFYVGADAPKPYLAPLRTASGLVVTRQFPMENVPNESQDHPHHRGLWLGYGNISGVNFWENEFTYKTTNRGTIVLTKLNGVHGGNTSGDIDASFDWRDPKGTVMIAEERKMTIATGSETRIVDMDTVLTAKQPLEFEDTKEGFFAIRVADSMREANGGTMENSDGQHGEKAVWGRRANWAAYTGTVGGHAVQIVMLDHPGNYNHPPRWHARAYGLFAVNPFGLKDFEPGSTMLGGKTLGAGEALRFRYRVIVHEGNLSPAQVAQWYADYSK